jgi:hypothetical protein
VSDIGENGTCYPLTDFKKAYDLGMRAVFCIIIIEFDILTKLVRLIKMCLTETYSKVSIGRYLTDVFSVHDGLKQGDAFSLLLINFALEYIIRKVQENQKGLELNGIHQPLVYTDDVIILSENVNTSMKNTEGLLEDSKEVGLEVNEEKTVYVYVSSLECRTFIK